MQLSLLLSLTIGLAHPLQPATEKHKHARTHADRDKRAQTHLHTHNCRRDMETSALRPKYYRLHLSKHLNCLELGLKPKSGIWNEKRSVSLVLEMMSKGATQKQSKRPTLSV